MRKSVAAFRREKSDAVRRVSYVQVNSSDVGEAAAVLRTLGQEGMSVIVASRRAAEIRQHEIKIFVGLGAGAVSQQSVTNDFRGRIFERVYARGQSLQA